MPSNHLILCCPLLLLPSIFPSIRVFSNESVLCIRWPKYWSFSFSISPSSEHPGLVSFRMDWLNLLAVQGTLKGLLQNHSSKASITVMQQDNKLKNKRYGHINRCRKILQAARCQLTEQPRRNGQIQRKVQSPETELGRNRKYT